MSAERIAEIAAEVTASKMATEVFNTMWGEATEEERSEARKLYIKALATKALEHGISSYHLEDEIRRAQSDVIKTAILAELGQREAELKKRVADEFSRHEPEWAGKVATELAAAVQRFKPETQVAYLFARLADGIRSGVQETLDRHIKAVLEPKP